jgi:hypothetical protein
VSKMRQQMIVKYIWKHQVSETYTSRFNSNAFLYI